MDRVGTQVVEQPLPPMAPYVDDGAEAVPRVAALSANDYIAVRDAALHVVFDGLARNEAVRALVQDPGLRAPTAESLLNNFRCLVEGRPFKAPMQASGLQIFVDATVMRLGDKALPNAIAAIQGFVDYATLTWGRVSTDISALLDALKGDAGREVVECRNRDTGVPMPAPARGLDAVRVLPGDDRVREASRHLPAAARLQERRATGERRQHP